MDTLPAVRYFANITNYAGLLGFVPYTWPLKSGRILWRKSNRIVKSVQFTWLLSQVVFMLFQLYRSVLHDQVSYFEKVRIMYLTVGISIVAYNVNVVYNDPAVIPALVNNSFRIFKQLDVDEGRPYKGKLASKGMESNLRGVKYACTFVAASYSLSIFRNPGDAKYLTSLVSKPEGVSLPWKILVGFYHMYAIAIEFGVIQLTFATVVVLTTGVDDVMQALRVPPQENLLTLKLWQIHHISQELGVLMQHFNATFSHYTVSLEVLGIITVVVNSVLTLMHESIRASVIACAFFLLTLVQYKRYAMVYEHAKDTHHTWRRMSSVPWFQKYCSAYRLPRIQMGGLYYADKSLVLTLLSTILNYMASLSMAARDG